MIKLILTDLDDTLIPVGAPSASPRAREAIHRLQGHGIRFAPISGRMPYAMEWMFAGDRACFRTGAYSNGQILHLDGETLAVRSLAVDALAQAQAILDEEGDAALAIYPNEADGHAVLYSAHPGLVGRFTGVFSDGLGEVRGALEAGGLYVKANVHVAGDFDRVCEVRDLLNAEVPGLDFVLPSQKAPIVDVLPAGWGKGPAVRALAEAVGAGLDEVVCFGDSENDRTMIEAVPNSVAVANAAEEIQDAARWHIGRAADDAVAEALEDIVRAAETGETPRFMRG